MGKVTGPAALEGGCSGTCSLPRLAVLAYKMPQAAEDRERSSEICFLMKVEQEIKIRPAENVGLKWDEDSGFFCLWEPWRWFPYPGGQRQDVG